MKKPDKKIMTSQVINDNRLGSFLQYMPNPDDIVSGTLESYETYRKMRTDGRIKSLLNKLKTTALNFPHSINQPEGCPDNVYSFIRDVPLFQNMYKKEKRMLAALDYGFSISEVVWADPAFNSGKWVPENIITRKPDRFWFSPDWELYWGDIGVRKKLDEDYKWLRFQHDPDDENPYGTSVLRCVYWAWMFKQAGYEFWLQATEKFSVKSIIALFEADGDENTIQSKADSIARMLLGVESGSASAVANIREVKEIGMAGDLIGFASLVDACDTQICYGLTGQSIATSKTDGGSLALGEVQADMLYEDCKGIALELQNVLQHVIDWTVELNFGADVIPPKIEFNVEKKASFDQLMQAIDRGVPVSKQALYNDYGLPQPADEEDTFKKDLQQGFMLSDSGKKKALNFS